MCQKKKNRAVLLLSTMHNNVSVTNDEEKKPEINIFYNETKGGVDCLDMLVHNYMSKRQTGRWPLSYFFNLVDAVGVAAFIVWTFQHPDWNSCRKNKYKLFLKDLGEKLVDAEISRRLQKDYLTKTSRGAIELMGYSIQQTAADEFEPKRKRCHLCPQRKDRKSRQECNKCHRNVCGEHSVSTKVCHSCVQNCCNVQCFWYFRSVFVLAILR